MTPEGKVKKKVKAVLAALGPSCKYFMPVQTGYGAKSLDFIISYRGYSILIETKRPGGTLTELQKGTKADWEAAGSLVFVVDDDASLGAALRMILVQGRTDVTDDFKRTYRTLYDGYIQHLASGDPEAKRVCEEYLRQFFQDKKAEQATGGDHGAPPTAPE